MTVRLTSNFAGASHQSLIRDLLMKCEEAYLASPFLYDDFSAWLDDVQLGSMKKLTLLTTLAPKGDDQLRKPGALLSLVRGIKQRWPNLQLVIQIDNKLHGKVYLFSRNGVLTDGIVTSANLTFSGLSAKHEWGVHLIDTAILDQLQFELNSVVEYPYITEELLERMCIFVDQFYRDNPKVKMHENIDAALFNALRLAARSNAVSNDQASVDGRFFLKPWGTKEEPVLREHRRNFGGETGNLDFPKGKPSDIRTGDIVITFGTGARTVLSVHKALSGPEERPEAIQLVDEHARRWPWFVFAQNLTPSLGGRWWEFDLTIDGLAKEFLSLNPGATLSSSGGTTLGSFQYGAGRLRLSDEFGQFLFERIGEVERSLKS